jgi:hypothetical protein
MHFADGSDLRGLATPGDQNAIPTTPAQMTGSGVNIGNWARGKWYHRKMPLELAVGKTIQQVFSAWETDATGFMCARAANARITNNGVNHLTIYSRGPVIPGAATFFSGYSGRQFHSSDLSFGAVSLDDHITDGGTFKRLRYVNSSGTITVSTALNGQGSIVPGQAIAISFSYTSNSISLSWASQTMMRSDGSTLTIPAGSANYTGLTPSTSYYMYPRVNASSGVIDFSNPSPPPTAPNTTYAIQQALDGFIPLPPLKQTLPAAGGSGSGTGGGSGTCPEFAELVDVMGKGFIPVGEVVAGDFIKGKCFNEAEDVYRQVVSTSTAPCADWYLIDGHRVSPCEPLYDAGEWKSAFLVDRAIADSFIGDMVKLTVASDGYDESNYYLIQLAEDGTVAGTLLIHNVSLPC